MPVFVMRSVLSANEFTGWLLYLQQRGPDVNEIQMAMLTTLVGKGLGDKSATIEKFIISNTETKNETASQKVNEVGAVLSAMSVKKMK